MDTDELCRRLEDIKSAVLTVHDDRGTDESLPEAYADLAALDEAIKRLRTTAPSPD